MLATIVRRLLQTVVVMLVMSALVFAGIYMVGDPVSMLASPEATEAQRAAIRASLGLDLPLWRQYLIFMGQAVRGDFGNSFLTGEPAMRLILERMPATVELASVAMLLSVLIGVPLGILAGLKPRAPGSRAIMTGSVLGFSLPNFWVGLMLIMVFAVMLGWSAGRRARADRQHRLAAAQRADAGRLGQPGAARGHHRLRQVRHDHPRDARRHARGPCPWTTSSSRAPRACQSAACWACTCSRTS